MQQNLMLMFSTKLGKSFEYNFPFHTCGVQILEEVGSSISKYNTGKHKLQI